MQRPGSAANRPTPTPAGGGPPPGSTRPTAPGTPTANGASRLTRPQTAPLSPDGQRVHLAGSSSSSSDPQAAFPRCRQAKSPKVDVVILNLPLIRDTPPGLGRKALVLKKLRLCCFLFDSSSSELSRVGRLPIGEQEADAKRREAKRMTLLELINYYSTFKPCLTADEYAGVFDMLAWNLFRPLPPSSFELHVFGNPRGISSTPGAGYTFSPEEDQQQEDPNWSHVQIAYEFLLRIVSFAPTAAQTVALPATKDNPHPEPNVTLHQLQASHKLLYSTYLSRRFILSLLANFASEDIRERDYLKTILHRIYGSSMALRPFIRRNIQHIILRTVYEDERQHGISELLEILGSIINGFAVPLKDTHIDTLLCKILLPLHKVTHLSLFHPQLSYAVMQFLEKDPKLANIVLVGLMRVWPQRNSKKEVLFVAEVEEVLERVPEMSKADPVLHVDVLSAVVAQIAACICSTHFQVSEKAIYLLNHEVCKKFIFFGGQSDAKDFRKRLVPIIARAIYINTELPLVNTLDAGASPHSSASSASLPPLHLNSSASSSAGSSDPLQADTPRGASKPSGGVGGSALKGNWNPTITELTQDVVQVVREFDPSLWEDALDRVRREYQAAQRTATALRQPTPRLAPVTVPLSAATQAALSTPTKTYAPKAQGWTTEASARRT